MERPRLPGDYHTHTALCGHAEGQPLDYAHSAQRRGLPAVAITDHGPFPNGFDSEHRMAMEDFDFYCEAVAFAQADPDVEVLLGVETDYFDGCEEFLRSWLASRPFDVVLGSVHYLDYWSRSDPEERTLWECTDAARVWQRYFELVGRLADTRLYDVVTHLDLPKRNGRIPPDHVVRETVLPALDRIARAGMAVEINTSGLRHPVKEMYPSAPILSWCAERSIPITFGSDAHLPYLVGSDFDKAVELARDAGYEQYVGFRRRTAIAQDLPPR